MARLLNTPQKQKASKAELRGKAYDKLKLNGSLGIPHAAEFLGIHKYTLRDHINYGHVETIQIGARHYLEEEELRRLQKLLQEYGSLAKAFQKNKS